MRRPFRQAGTEHQPSDAAAGAQVASAERAVAIGGDSYAPVLTGDHSRAVSLPPEALRPPAGVAAPAGLDNLAGHPGLFVGRASELDRLDTALATHGGAVVQAVHGLGGIGKSTLAAHWAATRPHGCAPVRWLTADTPAGVQQGLADLAGALQPALTGALPIEAMAEWALQWLVGHTGWLLILDNVNDPADIAPLLARTHTQGRFLITSRLATVWHHVPTVVRLDVLDEADALELLTRIATATAPGRTLDGAADLCAELGQLPLAVEQAAAYLAQNPLTTPRAYLTLLSQYPAAMYRAGAVGITPPERTIARIWHLTLDRITALQPQAADLLRLLAWYAPDRIPSTLLDGLTDPPALNAALGLLTAYNLITPDPATDSLAVHRLVQALARTPDPDDPHRTPHLVDRARADATALLAAALPRTWNTPRTWPAWHTLLPHIDALADHAPADTDTEATAHLLNRTGLFLHDQGRLTRAISHLRRAQAGTARLLGADHPDTLASRNDLAHAYQSAGHLDRAILLHEQTLKDRIRVLGVDHLAILTSRNNLAGAYQSAGNLDRAIPLYEQTLEDTERLVGADHPSTLTYRNNLAHAYQSAGNLDRAIPLFERALEDAERVLSADHPSTLAYRTNLAGAYQSAGHLDRATPLYEQALEDRIRVLGADHPDTLTSRNNLAHSYRSAGDLDRAVPLFERTLEDMERVLGTDHPSTLTTRNNLAYTYQWAGDPESAIPLHEQTLEDTKRVLSADHPSTLTYRTNLAGAYEAAGDLRRAIPLYEQTLEDRVRLLGADHPDTLTSHNNLAGAYERAGDLRRALRLYKQTLKDRMRVLGADHPDALASRNNLAHAYQSAGNLRRAIPLYKQALEDTERVLGTDHPLARTVRSNLTVAVALRAEQP